MARNAGETTKRTEEHEVKALCDLRVLCGFIRFVAKTQMDERALWNEKFRLGSHASTEPDPFLVSSYFDYVDPLLGDRPDRKALDLAGGTGRHAIFLAERGWDVMLLDVSDVGLERARREAEKRGATLSLRNEDASSAD